MKNMLISIALPQEQIKDIDTLLEYLVEFKGYELLTRTPLYDESYSHEHCYEMMYRAGRALITIKQAMHNNGMCSCKADEDCSKRYSEYMERNFQKEMKINNWAERITCKTDSH